MSAKRNTADRVCCNGDGRPVQPPSKVLCRECLVLLDQKFRDLAKRFGIEEPASPSRELGGEE